MDPILAPFQALLDLFTTELAQVQFGNLDAQTLSRVDADVRVAADAVAAAEAALDEARAALQERQETLLQQGHRALAYARVYAENDEALSARLDAIALPRPARRARAVASGEGVLVLSGDPQRTTRRRAVSKPRAPTDGSSEPLTALTLTE